MLSNDHGISLFVKRCNDLIEGKYLLAEKNISNLLRAIAASDDITKLVSDCVTGYDFKAEFDGLKIDVADLNSKTLFLLPADDKKFIAYCICLLWNFDTKEFNFNDYLKDYYTASGYGEKYTAFAETIVRRFKAVMLAMLNVLASSEEALENNAVLEKFFIGQKAEFGPFVVDDLVNLINNVSNTITSDAKLKMAKKKEMLTMCDGLANAIITKDKKLIKLMWIGFYNTCGFFDKIYDGASVMEKTFKKYYII